MLRTLIVDDEPLVRLALREMIDWAKLGCEVIGEASDGKLALHLFQKLEPIDVLIVDIQMPIMNGLALLERLKAMEFDSRPLIIVLSAFHDYEKVRAAFLLGATDYIIKTEMEKGHLNAVVEKGIAQLREQRQKHQDEEQAHLAERSREKMNLLVKLLQSESTELSLEKEHDQDWRELTANGKQCLVSILIDTADGDQPADTIMDEQTSRFIVNTAVQALGNESDEIVVQLKLNEYAVLLLYERSLGQQAARTQTMQTLERVRSQIKLYLNLQITIGVSDICTDWRQWASQYKLAKELAQLRFFHGGGRTYYPEQRSVLSPMPVMEGHHNQQHWHAGELMSAIASGENWEPIFNQVLQEWKQRSGQSIHKIHQYYKAMLWELGALLNAKGLDWEDVVHLKESPHEQIERFERFEQANEWLSLLIGLAAIRLDPKRIAAEAVPTLVERARKWIDQHYPEPISLTQLSAKLNVSESYLSKQFVKVMGVNFVTYLTRLRIRKSIEMMQSGMKLFEIGERVGYPNQAHFSRIFKKVTGITPQAYREEDRGQK